MPGFPVSIGAMVMLTPGAAGPPDTGTIVTVFPPLITANGMPLATTGSLCMMVNSLTGIPYPMMIGPLPISRIDSRSSRRGMRQPALMRSVNSRNR